MQIRALLWTPFVLDKISGKHGLSQSEVEQVFQRRPHFRKVQKGHVAGEDLYAALGRSQAGRLLIVLFLWKSRGEALIVTARDMDAGEKKYYAKHQSHA